MHDDSSIIHGIAYSILGISEDFDQATVKVTAKGVAGYSINIYSSFLESGTYEPLAGGVDDFNVFFAFPDYSVYFFVIFSLRINNHSLLSCMSYA